MAQNITDAQAWMVPGRARSFIRDIALSIGATLTAIANRYETAHALKGFDSRMLADIGLAPEDVSSAFSEPLWRDPTRRLAVLAVERRLAARSIQRHERQIPVATKSCELASN